MLAVSRHWGQLNVVIIRVLLGWVWPRFSLNLLTPFRLQRLHPRTTRLLLIIMLHYVPYIFFLLLLLFFFFKGGGGGGGGVAVLPVCIKSFIGVWDCWPCAMALPERCWTPETEVAMQGHDICLLLFVAEMKRRDKFYSGCCWPLSLYVGVCLTFYGGVKRGPSEHFCLNSSSWSKHYIRRTLFGFLWL